MRISFTIPGIPVAQPRQRTRVMVVAGRSMGQNYTPAKHPVQAFKATATLAASQAYHGAPIDGPLDVRVTFVLPRPARLVWKKRAMPREWAPCKPDLDNFLKALLDALTGVVWADDKSVVSCLVQKQYASGTEQPHTDVWIEVLEAYLDVTRSEYA